MSQNSNVPVNPIPLIFDDDGSQDGMTALAYILANPKFDTQAITIVNGIARPEVFDDNLKRMLGRLGDTDIPIGVGRSTPLSGNNEFPDFIRDGSDNFWSPFVSLPEEVPDIETKPAVDLIIETIKNSPEPVAILATGPLTNIAEAFRQDPSIIDNISIVQIMGGAVFVPGNLPVLPEPPFSTNETAEFNIWLDPVAAQEVFDAGKKGLKIQLTPLDATNKVEFDRQDYEEWLETGTPESAIAAELLDFALTVIQSDNDPNPVWDLVAAINLSEPDFSPETPLHIDVDTESAPGENQGQTKAVSGSPANVLVSLDPSFDNINFDAGEVFSYLELPIVSVTAEPTIFAEDGGVAAFIFNLSQPAPEEGLKIKFEAFDEDMMGGDSEVSLENISDIQIETGSNSSSFIIVEPGATEAKVIITGIPDDLPEGEESATFTLLEGEGYTFDSKQNSATLAITDLPIVSFSADKTVISEGGEPQLITINLSEPAPTGGLVLKSRLDDPDGEPGDTDSALEFFSNITDFVEREEDGVFFPNITIQEGATSATIGIKAVTDNKVEGTETISITLLENENYSIDPASTTITTTIEDTTDGRANVHNAVALNAIVNPGFEIPQLPEDQFTQTSLGEFIPGWKVFDPDALVGENVTDVGAFNPTPNVFPQEAPEGENTGYAYSQAAIGSGIFGLSQTLDTVLEANTEYTLQVEVGNTAENNPDDGFNYEGFPGYRVELLAGGKVLARDNNTISIAEGTFETSTVTFTAKETEPFLGQNLEIRLVNLLNGAGEDVEFDNVRLFAETVEPIQPNEIFGTSEDENLVGTDGNDNIFSNGGMDTLIGGKGNDNIYGSSDTDVIEGGKGDDNIFGNGGADLINSGTGIDNVFLATGEAIVILDKGEGFDTINNFQLGATKLRVPSLDNLSFSDRDLGVEIFQEDDLLAVVVGQSANTFSDKVF